MTGPIRLHEAHESACSVTDNRVPDSAAQRDEQTRILREAVLSLPDRERLVVTLHYSEDLRLKEIGQVLGLSEARVCRILNATLDKLRNAILVLEE